ncbi:MAG: ABC transporter permease [Candidatus Pacebacteria bacterium]|nr:ABC transporter permease [Candidatus Paceibacterota bacterium]
MSFWLSTKRVTRYGIAGFVRNGFISLAAILIMTITLFVVAGLMMSAAALNATLAQLTNKVDVTVYFTPNASLDQITTIQNSLKALPEVASVKYVSREDALAEFTERHKNDQLTLQALEELGENPLGASLEIRAKETSQYEAISKYLSDQAAGQTGSSAFIDKVNFFQNKAAIDRLTNIIETSQKLGIAITIILAVSSVLIAFNTIRLAIYTARDEIGVMNLVGAGHWYVRGPFMVSGILYGIVSAVIVLLVLYPVTIWLGPGSEKFLGSFNVFTYYREAFPVMLLTLMGTGIGIGALSSFLAVRRYLRM